jgi:hypothetical protein
MIDFIREQRKNLRATWRKACRSGRLFSFISLRRVIPWSKLAIPMVAISAGI